jgi:hypothetical protein
MLKRKGQNQAEGEAGSCENGPAGQDQQGGGGRPGGSAPAGEQVGRQPDVGGAGATQSADWNPPDGPSCGDPPPGGQQQGDQHQDGQQRDGQEQGGQQQGNRQPGRQQQPSGSQGGQPPQWHPPNGEQGGGQAQGNQPPGGQMSVTRFDPCHPNRMGQHGGSGQGGQNGSSGQGGQQQGGPSGNPQVDLTNPAVWFPLAHQAKEQLVKELQANLKQLKAVMQESSQIAKALEAALSELQVAEEKQTGKQDPAALKKQSQGTEARAESRQPSNQQQNGGGGGQSAQQSQSGGGGGTNGVSSWADRSGLTQQAGPQRGEAMGPGREDSPEKAKSQTVPSWEPPQSSQDPVQ